MLLNVDKTSKNTYGFKFQNQTELENIATIHALGIEIRFLNCNYYWNCQTRTESGIYIFQYTLSGCGEITIKEKKHKLPKGRAFLVSVPDDCQYYLPDDSDEWRFIFLTLEGSEARTCWEYINTNHGYVFDIPIEAPVIQRLMTTYVRTIEKQIMDAYRCSLKAYEFITFCYQHFENLYDRKDSDIPEDIKKCMEFMQEKHTQNLCIDEISEHVALSKSYLNKKFKKYTGMPLLSYLTQFRIEKSFHLLQHTQKSIKEISFELGFSDPNYFNKVFRKSTGISPGLFRKNKSNDDTFDFLITDQHGLINLD